jgi:hypothetical protein
MEEAVRRHWVTEPVVVRVGAPNRVPKGLRHRALVVEDSTRALAALVAMLRRDLTQAGQDEEPARVCSWRGAGVGAAFRVWRQRAARSPSDRKGASAPTCCSYSCPRTLSTKLAPPPARSSCLPPVTPPRGPPLTRCAPRCGASTSSACCCPAARSPSRRCTHSGGAPSGWELRVGTPRGSVQLATQRTAKC